MSVVVDQVVDLNRGSTCFGTERNEQETPFGFRTRLVLGRFGKAGIGSVHSHNSGARIYLDEILELDGVDRTCALFSESTGRLLVSVGREDDVKFVGLCEARDIPVLRIGVTDNSGELDIQDVATWQLKDLRAALTGALPERSAKGNT